MLWLNPSEVDLLGVRLTGVTAVAVNRSTTRSAIGYGDLGPHVVFADSPERRVTVRIKRRVEASDADVMTAIALGAQGALSFRVSGSVGDRAGRSVSATVVVLGVEHDLSERDGFAQTITMAALSSDGAADPIVEAGESS